MTVIDRTIDAWAVAEEKQEMELALIERCCQGDENAYAALYHQYASYIYRLAYGFLQHKEDAEEVLQDTFEYAFRRIDRYDVRRAKFKTWLYQIAASRCRNKRRRKWLPTFPWGQLEERVVHDPQAALPDEALLLSARQQIIWAALSTLSPKLRETAVLRYYEELSYPEIGQVLGISPKTAESRMRLAHAALKRAISE